MTILQRQNTHSSIKQEAKIKLDSVFQTPFKVTLLTAIFLANGWASASQSTVQDIVTNKVKSKTEQPIERMVVTANRSKTTLLSTASSVDAINSSALDLIGHQHISQALSRISGTWISRGNGQEHLTAVRSPVLTGAGGCGAFFMAVDGISLRAPGFCNANQLFDANSEQAQSIEVLRGPASTLYGTNAVHGVINILSPDAFSNDVNYLAIRAGRDDHIKTSLGFRSQQNNSAFGVFTNITQNNGYQADSGYDQQKLTAVYEHKGDVWQNKTLVDMANLNQETAGFVEGFEVYRDAQIRRSNPNPEAYRDAKSLRAYSAFSRDLETGKLTLTPFLRWNEMAFLQHFLPWKALEENSSTSVGLQAQYYYVIGALSLTAGIDTDFTRANLRESQAQDFSPTIPAGEHYDFDVDASQIGSYLQLQWQIEDFLITAGGRLEYINYDYDNLLSDGSACAANVTGCRFSRPSDQDVDFTVFSPSLSLLYSINSEQSIYAKWSQGYRAPQATELFRLQNGQEITDLDEEKMDALELGWRLYTDSFNINASVFMQDKSNFIFQDSNRQNVSNGETEHNGAEVSATYNFNNNIYINANVSYAEHNYTNDLTLARTSIKGNEIDTAPQFMGSAQLGWNINPSLLTELSLQRMGNYYLNPENSAEYAGHTLLDLNLRYAYSEQLVLSANIYNLLDEDYAERADSAFGNYRYFVGQPRRIFLTATWQWAQ
jgi:outer membrane receptor protein involved in Fe transport